MEQGQWPEPSRNVGNRVYGTQKGGRALEKIRDTMSAPAYALGQGNNDHTEKTHTECIMEIKAEKGTQKLPEPHQASPP